MFDLPPHPKLWMPAKPAIIRAASLDDMKLAMPVMGTFAAAAARGLRPNVVDYGALTQITDYTGTTNIGDLTGGGGLAAVFDGNTNQANTASGRALTAGDHYAGKGWASAQRIGRIDIYTCNNDGGSDMGTSFQLYGKNSSPANATDGTVLLTISSPADLAQGTSVTYQVSDGIDTSAKYSYHWAAWVGSAGVQFAEVIFWGYAN